MKSCVTSFFSQQLRPSRTLTVWSWRGRWRRGVGQRAAPENLTWRTFTDSTGIHILFWFFFSEEVLSVIVLTNSLCVFVKWGADVVPAGARGFVAAVLSEVSGERASRSGSGCWEESFVSVSAGEPGPEDQKPGESSDTHSLIRLLHVRMGRGILTTVFSNLSRSWAVTSQQRSPDFVPWRNRTPCSSIRGWMCMKWRWVSSSFAPVQMWKHRKETVQMKMRGNCYLTSTFHPF